MILLDSNVILRFVLGNDPILSPKAKKIFEQIQLEKDEIYLSLMVISEVIFTLERSYKLPRSEIVENLLPIIRLPNVKVENIKLIETSFTNYLEKNISFPDTYHVALMELKKIKQIYSFDTDFDKFKKIIRKETP